MIKQYIRLLKVRDPQAAEILEIVLARIMALEEAIAVLDAKIKKNGNGNGK